MSRFCVYGYTFVFSALPPSYRPYNSLLFIISKITVKVKKTALLTGVEVDADILANFVGTKLLTDENAIRYVVGYKRSFGVWMHEQITRLKATLGSKNAKTQAFLDKAARLYHAALAESKNAVRSENGGKKHDIVVLDNGMMYVQASRNIIHGDNVTAWRKQITDFYKKMLNDMPSIDIQTAEGDVLTITEAETAHKARDNFETINGQPQKMTNDKFKVKLKAESHIDEIAEVSRLGTKTPTPDAKQHSFAKNGFTYRTAYFKDVDGAYYRLSLSIGNAGNTATIYNVGKIEEDAVPSATIVAAIGSKAVEQHLPAHSISEIGENVNSSSKKSFSVSEIQGENEDYGQGVILDTEIFKGISPRNWGKTLRDYFYKNLAGKEFTAYDEDGRSEVIHLARKKTVL